MFEIKVIEYFSAAHFLQNYHGKCENIHGHNWKVEVAVRSALLNEGGMVMDFKILKQELKKVLSTLDHKSLNELEYFSKIEPSSENIAYFIFNQLKEKINSYGFQLKYVSAWESENSCALYYEE
ncbi:MAG: 6-carboxytetrahydropterin synthase QueD [Deltaproteobacteria bacterium]|nr:MAG: 6-carboxytetrahydropterin synthase QueD [Deltaproteobacteria bacterium]